MVINMKITVLAGGTSTERDVSLVTGSMIYKSLVKSGHQVVLVDLYLGYDGADYTDVFAIKKDWSESIQAISSQNPDIRQVRAMRKDDPYNEVGPLMSLISVSRVILYSLHCMDRMEKMVRYRQCLTFCTSSIQEQIISQAPLLWIR